MAVSALCFPHRIIVSSMIHDKFQTTSSYYETCQHDKLATTSACFLAIYFVLLRRNKVANINIPNLKKNEANVLNKYIVVMFRYVSVAYKYIFIFLKIRQSNDYKGC